MAIDKKKFKQQPQTLVKDARSGDINRIIHPADTEIGTRDTPADLTVFGEVRGSIRNTSDGLSYLVAGANTSISSGSNGQITIASTGGGGFTPPTGTGFCTITTGAVDATALVFPLSVANGGTGLSAIGTALYHIRVNAAGTSLEYVTPPTSGVTRTPEAVELSIGSTFFTTTSTTYSQIGGRKVDMSLYPTVLGYTRHVQFLADVQKTSGATSVQVQLYDLTNVVQVTSMTHSADNALTEKTSGDLTVGSSAGNIRSDVAAMYEVDVKMNGGGGSDAVMITNARILIYYI